GASLIPNEQLSLERSAPVRPPASRPQDRKCPPAAAYARPLAMCRCPDTPGASSPRVPGRQGVRFGAAKKFPEFRQFVGGIFPESVHVAPDPGQVRQSDTTPPHDLRRTVTDLPQQRYSPGSQNREPHQTPR